MITASGLTKRLGRTVAVRAVDFNIAPGECVCIFGPNGAGKTTLLKLAAGILRPSAGRLLIEGGPPRSVRARIGYLGHDTYLYPHLTAAENLRLFAGLYGAPAPRAAEALEWVGMAAKSEKPAGELSRGEAQRTGLARAMVNDPDYLIVDEPFSSIDLEGVDTLAPLLRRAGRTVLVATHDLGLGESLADRVFKMQAGKLA